MNTLDAMPAWFGMVDERAPGMLTARPGDSAYNSVGGICPVASLATHSAATKQQDGAAVPRDPSSTLNGRFRRGGCSTASQRRGGGLRASRQSCCRESSALAAASRSGRPRRPRWNSGCSTTGWIVAPRPRNRQQPPTSTTTSEIQGQLITSSLHDNYQLTELQDEHDYWQQRAAHWQQKYDEALQQAAAAAAKSDMATAELAEATARITSVEQQHEATRAQASAENLPAREWQQAYEVAQREVGSLKKQFAEGVATAENKRQQHAAERHDWIAREADLARKMNAQTRQLAQLQQEAVERDAQVRAQIGELEQQLAGQLPDEGTAALLELQQFCGQVQTAKQVNREVGRLLQRLASTPAGVRRQQQLAQQQIKEVERQVLEVFMETRPVWPSSQAVESQYCERSTKHTGPYFEYSAGLDNKQVCLGCVKEMAYGHYSSIHNRDGGAEVKRVRESLMAVTQSSKMKVAMAPTAAIDTQVEAAQRAATGPTCPDYIAAAVRAEVAEAKLALIPQLLEPACSVVQHQLTLSGRALADGFARISVYIYIVQMGVFGVLLGVGMAILSHYGLNPVNWGGNGR